MVKRGKERERDGEGEREGGKEGEREGGKGRGRAEEKRGSELAKVTKCEKVKACFICTFFLLERVYRPTKSGQVVVIDPHSRIMVLLLDYCRYA